MLKGDELLGVILTYRLEVKPFTDTQIALVETFADQAVIAIENVRLFDEVQARTNDLSESLQQQTATADVLRVISRSTFDLQTVLNTLVESAKRLCGADHALLFRRDGETCYLAANHGRSHQFEEYFKQHPIAIDRGSLTGRTVLEGKAIHIPDAQNDPEYTMTELIKLDPFRTMLGVPLLREGSPIGVITSDAGDSPAVYEARNPACHDFRRPGGDRHRERAACSTKSRTRTASCKWRARISRSSSPA